MIDNLTEAIRYFRQKARNIFLGETFDNYGKLAEWLTELQERREADRWIPVSERLPEDRHAVLVYCPEYDNIYCAFHDAKHWCVFGAYDTIWQEVTHWRPLPEPYKESEGTE